MKISAYVGKSLDGFIARKNGDFTWLSQFANDEAIAAYNEFMGRIDAIVIGRGTFDEVLKFPEWPYEKPVFVLSTSIGELPDAAIGKATLLSMSPRAIAEHLASEGFSNIYIDGGTVIQSFLKEGLVDELIIATVPILIGNGLSLFGEGEKDIPFRHVRTIVASNGLVRSYYDKE
ncbi:MAG: dihydrofolate reductase family protein [Acidobacteriota bacterium]